MPSKGLKGAGTRAITRAENFFLPFFFGFFSFFRCFFVVVVVVAMNLSAMPCEWSTQLPPASQLITCQLTDTFPCVCVWPLIKENPVTTR